MVTGLFGIDAICLSLVRGRNVVWTEVERSDDVEGDLTVKAKALEPDRGDFVAALVECTDLYSDGTQGAHIGINRWGRKIGEAGLTDCGDEEAMLWE